MIFGLNKYLKNIVPAGEWLLQRTADAKFGDFASNLAFRLAKSRNKPPYAVAEELVAELKAADKDDRFSRIEAATPGFVNFWLSPKAFVAEVENILNDNKARLPRANNPPAGGMKS